MIVQLPLTDKEKNLILALLKYTPQVETTVEDEEGTITTELVPNISPEAFITEAFKARKDDFIREAVKVAIDAAAKTTIYNLKMQEAAIVEDVLEQGVQNMTAILKSKI